MVTQLYPVLIVTISTTVTRPYAEIMNLWLFTDKYVKYILWKY